MVDFSSLLDAKAGDAIKPKALPPGDYPGIIKAFQMLEAAKDKNYKTIIRFTVGVTAWPEGTEEQDMIQETKPGVLEPVDLSKKSFFRDFYDHRLFDLDAFLDSCGSEFRGRSYREVLPELVGTPVLVEVGQYVNPKTNEIGNQVNNLRGISN